MNETPVQMQKTATSLEAVVVSGRSPNPAVVNATALEWNGSNRLPPSRNPWTIVPSPSTPSRLTMRVALVPLILRGRARCRRNGHALVRSADGEIDVDPTTARRAAGSG